MSQPKELNFFFGNEGDDSNASPVTCQTETYEWTSGNRHRGLSWYARHFDHLKPVRGESSPGYTSPNHDGVADAIAKTIPDVRLVYAVRDPVDRAISQYRHHVRDGTERRPPEEALSDERSQYIARSLYHRRLTPFLQHFSRDRITIVAQEDLMSRPHETLGAIFSVLAVSSSGVRLDVTPNFPERARTFEAVSDELREELTRRFLPDVQLLEEVAERRFDWPSVAL